MDDETKLQIGALADPREQGIARALKEQIKSAWEGAPVPPAELILQGLVNPDRKKIHPESVEYLDWLAGKTNDELPFDNSSFQNLCPFQYLSLVARNYYICAYMINCLNIALASEQRPFAACGQDTIVTISALLQQKPDWKITGLTEKQWAAVRAFLNFVLRHAKFYFAERRKHEIEKYLRENK